MNLRPLSVIFKYNRAHHLSQPTVKFPEILMIFIYYVVKAT